MKRILATFCFTILTFSVCFSSTAIATIDLPTYQVGDFWKYHVREYAKMVAPNDTFYTNSTWLYNITGEKTVTISGTNYDVYNVSVQMNGTGLVMCGILAHHTITFMNATEYWVKSNLSKIWSCQETNTSSDPGGWRWSLINITYHITDKAIKFPVNIDNTWFNNYSYYEKAHYKSVNYGSYKESWSNITVFSNNSCTCELQETISGYDCYKIRNQNADNLSIQPTYTWISATAGSAMVQKRVELFTTNIKSYECWNLIDGKFNGNPLPPIPFPPMPEYIVYLLPLTSIIALIVINSRKRL